MSTKKYRPYFTLLELKYLSDTLKLSHPPNIYMIRYMDKYISDIEAGFREPNHALKPSLEEKLDMMHESLNEDLNSRGAQLFNLYTSQQNTFKSFSPKDIEVLQEYRYSNNLMSNIEETQYEFSLGLTKN